MSTKKPLWFMITEREWKIIKFVQICSTLVGSSHPTPCHSGEKKSFFVCLFVLNSVAGGHLATQRKQRCSGISCFPSHPCCVRYHPCCHGTFTSPRGIGGPPMEGCHCPCLLRRTGNWAFCLTQGPLSSARGFVALGFVLTKCKISRVFSRLWVHLMAN